MDDRNDLPKVHDRNRLETEAKHAVQGALAEHDLTIIEEIRLLSSIIDHRVKLLLRFERHGDYDSPADVAPTQEDGERG